MKFDVSKESDKDKYDIEILDGVYAGKYKAIKHYVSMKAFNEVWLNEYDSPLEVHKVYDVNNMKLMHSSFFIFDSKGNTTYFDREYNASIVLSNDQDLPPITTIDSKPVHLDRVWNNGDYSYEINKYTPEEFLKRSKYLFIKNSEKDIERLFNTIGNEFGIDLSIYFDHMVVAKETTDPYRLKIYGEKNKSLCECIIDKTDKSKFLIINHLLSDEKLTMVFRKDFDKEKTINEYSYIYTINTGIKNPLLCNKITEVDGVPVMLKYNDKQLICEYDKNDTTVEVDLERGVKGSFVFHPATWRFNRDHIFGKNLYYFDSITKDGDEKQFRSNIPDNEVYRRILYRRVED